MIEIDRDLERDDHDPPLHHVLFRDSIFCNNNTRDILKHPPLLPLDPPPLPTSWSEAETTPPGLGVSAAAGGPTPLSGLLRMPLLYPSINLA